MDHNIDPWRTSLVISHQLDLNNFIRHHALSPDLQPVLYTAKSIPILGCQLPQEYIVGDSVKGFAKV